VKNLRFQQKRHCLKKQKNLMNYYCLQLEQACQNLKNLCFPNYSNWR
jgi:hypothetical protein